MDIGKMNDNYAFYEGYEGEPEIVLRVGNNATIHIWEGYFDDIFDTPSLDGNGWIGFTRDYHQFEGAFSEEADETIPVEIDPKEYLEDILQYKEKSFDFEETTDVLNTIVEALQSSIEYNISVTVEKI